MTKYIEGNVIELDYPNIRLVVRKINNTKTCTRECYFGKYINNSSFFCNLNFELGNHRCSELIPNDCCFKELKEGV